MGVYIAQSITITPTKIISVGYSNNVLPHEPRQSIIDNTPEELRAIAVDLIDGMIEPRQNWWMNMQSELRNRFSMEDIHKDNKMKQAVKYMINMYNVIIIQNYHRLLSKGNKNIVFQLLKS